MTKQKLAQLASLMRLNRPIGIYLVVWPSLWALWLAAEGLPRIDLLVIFFLGAVIMRSAGCVINDYADRHVDGAVSRTQQRPMVTGEISPKEAILLFSGLCVVALVLVLLTNRLTLLLSTGGLLLAFCYPFMKRYTHMPQVVLGAAFAWSIPMAFAAQTKGLDPRLWIIYTSVVLWTVTYDTFYAMVDRPDDLKTGIKSTAILFGENDRIATALLQVMTLFSLVMVGQRFHLSHGYQLSLVVVAALFAYQQFLIRNRDPQLCFKAFLNNNWVGMAVFIGIFLDYALVSGN
ncbi:MAG: 4-hydroxybenzoate polyprenyltransferase [Lentisphaeria bacterium]|jgi:4-hydroxybenzoate polyprenyltransferase